MSKDTIIITSINQFIETLKQDDSFYKGLETSFYNNQDVCFHCKKSFIDFAKQYKLSKNMFCQIKDKYNDYIEKNEDYFDDLEIEIYEESKLYNKLTIIFYNNTVGECLFTILNNYMKEH